MRHRLAHRVGRSSQATTAAVDKSPSALNTKIQTLPASVTPATEAALAAIAPHKYPFPVPTGLPAVVPAGDGLS